MYFRALFYLSICSVLLLAAQCTAMAGTVTFDFTGVVTRVEEPLKPRFSLGDSVAGSYSFEATAADMDPDPENGDYDDAITVFTATFGDDFTVTQGVDNDIWVANGPPWNDVYALYINQPVAPAIDGYNVVAVLITMVDVDAMGFSSDALPLTPPDLSQFDEDAEMTAAIFFGETDSEWLHFRLTSLTLVPEPSMCALAVLGLFGIGWFRRNRP